MEIKHKQEADRGIFYIEQGNEEVAELTYMMTNPTTMLISHTGVKPSLRGKGVALQLVEAASDFARESNFKVIPSCSYVRVVYERRPDLKELMK